jgi:hypothetical protein
MRLFYDRMDAVLGLLGIGLWILSVIALAAAVTYIVVRVSPGGDENARPKSQA